MSADVAAYADGLRLPNQLLELIEAGNWPRDSKEERRQNLGSHVSIESVQQLAAEESYGIYLLSPPFRTVRRRVEHGEKFWLTKVAAPSEIDFEQSVVIADFGPGSDAPVLLDYSNASDNPRVMRLRWGEQRDNHWVVMTETFAAFADALALGTVRFT